MHEMIVMMFCLEVNRGCVDEIDFHSNQAEDSRLMVSRMHPSPGSLLARFRISKVAARRV